MNSYCQFAFEEPRARCQICDRAVALESSKADEYGRAVHEDCYVDRLVPNHQTAHPVLLRKPPYRDKPKEKEKESRHSAITQTMFLRLNSLRMPPGSADVAAVVALAIVAWFACTNHRPALPPQASKAVYEQHATGVTAPKSVSSAFRRFRHSQNEVDYIAEDVTIRIFERNPEASPTGIAYRQVNFGKDVTVRYISSKPTVGPESYTRQPDDTSSPSSDKPVSRPSAR